MLMEADKKDVFDRLMSLPGLGIFNSYYIKHKLLLLYVFFGGCTTLISIGTFVLFSSFWGIKELVANIFSWVCAVTFAYVTNRHWVFTSKTKGAAAGKEAVNFFVSRLFSLGVEEVLIFLFVTLLAFNGVAVKILGQILVLVLNFLLSKLWVFHSKG